jgi:tetratricopeptide (TPR) repeat protein
MHARGANYAPSDAAVASARAALAVLPPATGPEVRALYQFALGFHLLWRGDLQAAEAELSGALDMSEQTGDVSLQARCLAYLTLVHRRQGRGAEVERFAHRGLAAAETAGMLEYTGAAHANLAWLAWRRGDLIEAGRLGQAALEVWRRYGPPYPLHWQALWPLVGVASTERRFGDAVLYARQLRAPVQQALAPEIDAALCAALEAWDAGRPDPAHKLLAAALDLARGLNLA